MKLFKYIFLLTIMICLMACESTSVKNTSSIIRNGIPWFDDRGNIVNAHGACIVKEGGRYYLFGEWKSMIVMLFQVLAVIRPKIWLTGNLRTLCCPCRKMVFLDLTEWVNV